MEGPPLGPGGEDITWPDQVAPRGRKASSTRKITPQTSNLKPGRVSELLADLDHWAGRLTPSSYSSDDLLFWLVANLPRELWDECRSTAERKARALHYEDLCVLLLELGWRKKATST